jgi:hypothetical protein
MGATMVDCGKLGGAIGEAINDDILPRDRAGFEYMLERFWNLSERPEHVAKAEALSLGFGRRGYALVDKVNPGSTQIWFPVTVRYALARMREAEAEGNLGCLAHLLERDGAGIEEVGNPAARAELARLRLLSERGSR